MVRVPPFDTIEYLVRRKFFPGTTSDAGGPATLNALAQPMLPHPQNILAKYADVKLSEAMQRYREELGQKTAEEIAALWMAEKQAELAAAEAGRFFNQPWARRPDYAHYGRMPYWTLDEAVALSFGRDPARVTLKSVKPYAPTSSFAAEYVKRAEEVKRAAQAGLIRDPVSPVDFLERALATGWTIPSELTAAARTAGDITRDWRQEYQTLRRDSAMREANLEAALAESKSSLDQARLEIESQKLTNKRKSEPRQSDMSKRLNTACKIAFGLFKLKYKCNLLDAATPSAKKITEDLLNVGVSVDDKPLMDYLRQGSEQAAK